MEHDVQQMNRMVRRTQELICKSRNLRMEAIVLRRTALMSMLMTARLGSPIPEPGASGDGQAQLPVRPRSR